MSSHCRVIFRLHVLTFNVQCTMPLKTLHTNSLYAGCQIHCNHAMRPYHTRSHIILTATQSQLIQLKTTSWFEMPIWKKCRFVGLFQAFFWQGRAGPTPAPVQLPQQPTDCIAKSLQQWTGLGLLKSALELGRDTPNAVRGLSS